MGNILQSENLESLGRWAWTSRNVLDHHKKRSFLWIECENNLLGPHDMRFYTKNLISRALTCEIVAYFMI